MALEIISWSISVKVLDRAGTELATPGSAVRHVTDCATRPCCSQRVKSTKHVQHYAAWMHVLSIIQEHLLEPQVGKNDTDDMPTELPKLEKMHFCINADWSYILNKAKNVPSLKTSDRDDRKCHNHRSQTNPWHHEEDTLTLYLIETPFDVFANRADPDQAALIRLLCCLWKYDLHMILHLWTWHVISLFYVQMWKCI